MCEREIERERERERESVCEREREKERDVCVFVCERERVHVVSYVVRCFNNVPHNCHVSHQEEHNGNKVD